MTVERRFSIFDLSKVLFDKVVTSDHVRDAFAAIVYLYEAIGNEPPADSGSQVYASHDHADQGGAYIVRGCQGSRFGGTTPLFVDAPIGTIWEVESSSNPYYLVAGDSGTGNRINAYMVKYASPGIDTIAHGVFWEMRMRVHWPKDIGFNCVLRIVNPDFKYEQRWLKRESEIQGRVDIEIEPRDEMQELTILLPVKGDYYNRLNLSILALGGTAPYTDNLSIYDFQIHETPNNSQPRSRGSARFR